MSKFRNFYTAQGKSCFISNAGSPVVKEYKLDDEGINLIESGEHNIQDEINSHYDSCALETIIKRYKAGDLTALNANPDRVDKDLDLTYAPTNLIEAMDLYKKATAILKAYDEKTNKKVTEKSDSNNNDNKEGDK